MTQNNNLEDNKIPDNSETDNKKSSFGNNIPDNDHGLSEKFLSIKPENFNEYTYSKKSHFNLFQQNKFDLLFYGTEIGFEGYDIKTYQNLLLFSFITQNISEGSNILIIGSADDLIYNHFRYRYQCWRMADPSNLINDREIINNTSFIQNCNEELTTGIPSGYFDLIISASAFDGIPNDKKLFRNILDNIIYMMKPGGYSMHCFSAPIVEEEHFFYHDLLNFFNNNVTPLFYNVRRFLRFPVRTKVISDPDLHFTIEEFKRAKEFRYDDNLKTSSYNFLWRKNPVELSEFSDTKIKNFTEKTPAYIFHHLMKCGGTSLTIAFQDWFSLKLDHIKTDEITVDLNQYLNFKYNLENVISEDCIVSHFQSESYFLHQRYPEALGNRNKFSIFTFVREPLSIVTSLYYYARKGGSLQDISLIHSIKYSKENFLASLFPCDETNYKEILNRYFFIGIVEKMQESMDKLAKLLNKKRIIVPLSNTTEKDSQMKEITPEFIAEFKEKNKLDYLIYNYCIEKFNKL